MQQLVEQLLILTSIQVNLFDKKQKVSLTWAKNKNLKQIKYRFCDVAKYKKQNN